MENTKKATDFNAAAGRALDLTGRLIDQFGPRPAGSDQSRETADALKAEAASFSDAAWSEDFPVRSASPGVAGDC